MTEYALLRYAEIPVLLELENTAVFHPVKEVSFVLDNYPEYVEGVLSPADQRVSLLIHLGNMLSLNLREGEQEILLEYSRNESITVRIPLPEVVELDIDHKDLISHQLPSAEYCDVNGVTHLVIQLENLFQTIRKDLEEVKVSLPVLEASGLNPERKKYRSTTGMEQIGSSQSTQGILLQVGNLRLVVEESYVIEIVQKYDDFAPHPNGADWIRGLVRYKDEAIIAISSGKYLGVDYEPIMDLILGKNGNIFVIDADSIESIILDDYTPVYSEGEISGFPFLNLFQDEDGIFYHINLDCIIENIIDLKRFDENIVGVGAFFSRSRRQKEYELIELQNSESMEYLNLIVGGVNCFLKNTQVTQIGVPSNFDLPTINLGSVLDVKSDPKFAVVADVNGGQVALLCDDITTTPEIRTEVSREIVSKLNPELEKLGFREIVEDGEHVGLIFDASTMSSATNSGTGSIENQEHEIGIEESNYGIWFMEYETLLRVKDGEGFRYFSTETIQNFTVEDDGEIINPFGVQDQRMILVKSEGKTYAIPRGSSLANVQQSKISSKKGRRYFDLEGDQVEIEKLGGN